MPKVSISIILLYETKEMYPEEYEMAEYAVRTIREKLGVDLGQEEIGFIALHFHGALTNQHISEVRKHSELIADLVRTVEQHWIMPSRGIPWIIPVC